MDKEQDMEQDAIETNDNQTDAIAAAVSTTDKEESKNKKEPKKDKGKKTTVSREEYDKQAAQLEDKEDQFLRLRAEYDNFRKRSLSEKTSIYNNAVSDVVNAILPVADNIDRALSQDHASGDDIRKGVEMIAGQFAASFEQLGVRVIGEKGEAFDPNLHNAVAHIEDDSLSEGVIANVLQKGYMIGDKVIRHAMVQVAN